MINVTKTFLPPLEDYVKYLEGIWDRSYVTNRGPLVLELEEKLKQYLSVPNLLFVSNGTIALQIAIKALDLKGEIITTPFSYVATTTSIIWENCLPVFVDIEPNYFCIDPFKIEEAITEKTTAILATHVYGYPCNIEIIEQLANKYGLKVIYDGAHAFGTKYKDISLLNFGDISTISFHATKLFHTIEGGAIITRNKELFEKITLFHQFGHFFEDYKSVGINGKNSEIHAAMGLCNMPYISKFIKRRAKISEHYNKLFSNLPFKIPNIPKFCDYNYSYYPVIFSTETELLKVMNELQIHGINTRRYFYPSLNTLPYLKQTSRCPVGESISRRVLCLPLYYELSESEVDRIGSIIKKCF